MSLTNEELNQIVSALGIELPQESIEEHLNRAYNNRPWTINQALRDIESCDLIIRPGKAFWDILNRYGSFIPEYNYILGFRSTNYYDLIELDWLIYKYKIEHLEIDISNKKKATEEIYSCLMEIAENAMRKFACEASSGIGEQWYSLHRFEILHRVSDFIDGRLIRKPPLTGSFDKKQELIDCAIDLVLSVFHALGSVGR